MALADLIVVMNGGKVEDAGPPERVYARPATRFVATFMGESTLIEGRAGGGDGAFIQVDTPEGRLAAVGTAPPGGTVTVSIRPERLRLAPREGDGAVAAGVVTETVFQGGFVRVKARTASGTPLLAKVPPEEAPAAGTAVRFHARPDDCILLAGGPSHADGPDR